MKKILTGVGLAGMILASGCLEQSGAGSRSYKGPLFRYHFAGRAQLPSGTSTNRLKEIDALPITGELRGQLADKLAATAWPFWRKDLPAGTANQGALLRPLWDDFLAAEAYVEVRGAPGRTDTALAIELSDERAQLWSAKLKQLMAAWKLGTPRDIAAEGFKGWEAKKAPAPGTFRFFRAGKWVLLALAQDNPEQLPALLQEARKTGRPVPALSGRFLDLAVDFPGLRPWFPLGSFPLPPVLASMSGLGENVRTEVKFQYSSKIPWTYEAWKIPTNLISEPLISFTLGQGIAPLLRQVKGLAEVGLDPMPNQFCCWGIKHAQCRMFVTLPVPHAVETMRATAAAWPKFLQSTLTNSHGEFFYVSNRAELVWGSLPFSVPVIHAEQNGKDEFLFAAIFPLQSPPTPVPEELFAQVRGRTNLIYYDWELTDERLVHGKQFYQLLYFADSRRLPPTNTVSKRWLSAIRPKLGNTITEITQSGPQELSLVRKSHLGFTGFEIATFSAWLDTPGFPLSFEMPPALLRSPTHASPTRAGAAATRTNKPAGKATSPPKTSPPPGGKP